MSWRGRPVLVTGAGGFVGSHLTERLVELGAEVRALVHYNALDSWGWLDRSAASREGRVIAGDVCDRESVHQAMQGTQVVFHLAALIAIPYSYHAPRSYVRTNIEGTLNVLQSARELGVERVVHTSTSETYGSARYVPIDEDHPLVGQSPYAASKIGADKLAESFYSSFDLPVATLRPFNTYGPRQSARAVVPTIITQALTSSEVRLGNLAPTRDLCFVRDTVEGFIKIAERPQAVGQVINLGTGQEISIGDLARTIVGLLGKDVAIVSEAVRQRPERSEVDRLCASNVRARELLGWQPRFSLREGLERTIAWLERNLDHYRPGRYAL